MEDIRAVVLSKNEVIGICRSKKPGAEFVCQFKNGIDTQHIPADWVREWISEEEEKHGKIYGATWRCWTAMPTAEQEASTPWDTPNEVGQGKPALGASPYYVNISARICELCEAIKRYSTETGKHNKIALWCKEILYLNEVDRNLRYDESCKVWIENKNGTLKEMP